MEQRHKEDDAETSICADHQNTSAIGTSSVLAHSNHHMFSPEGCHNGFSQSKSQQSLPEVNGDVTHVASLGGGVGNEKGVIRILEGGVDFFVDVKPFLVVNHPRYNDGDFHYPSGEAKCS